MEVDAVLLAGLLLDDRTQDVLHRPRHQRRAEHEHVRLALLRERVTDAPARRTIAPWSWLPFGADGVPTQTNAISLSRTACRDVRGDADAAACGGLLHELDHALLHDRRLAGAISSSFARSTSTPMTSLAVARQACERYRADVSEAENADLHAALRGLGVIRGEPSPGSAR